MEGRELQADNKRLQSFPKFSVWIIEYVWAHRMMDIQEGWFEMIIFKTVTSDNSTFITLQYIALQQ